MNHTTRLIIAVAAAIILSTTAYAVPEQRALASGGFDDSGFGGSSFDDNCGFGCGQLAIAKALACCQQTEFEQKPSPPPSTVPICTTVTVPVPGTSLHKTYTVPQGFTGNPATANGKCVVDNTSYSQAHPCTITNGIATAGHCESITKGYQVTPNGPANLPTEEWFHLNGVTLTPGQFLDVADTTQFFTTKGHMATVLPCDSSGQPLAQVFEGIIDAGVNTLEPIAPEFLQQLSSPGSPGLCVYHFDTGVTTNNPDGVTDFAILNVSNQPITFTDRNTSTFSVTQGYLNAAA
jgi:hypothetical protein